MFYAPGRKSGIQPLWKLTKYVLSNMYVITALIFILTIYLLTDSMIDSFLNDLWRIWFIYCRWCWWYCRYKHTEMADSMIGTRQMVVASNLPRRGFACIRHRRRLRSQCWKARILHCCWAEGDSSSGTNVSSSSNTVSAAHYAPGWQ
jgi:hypothetical protein